MIRSGALCAVLLAFGVAHAQGSNNQISFEAIMKAPVGSWAEYQITKEQPQAAAKARYTLVTRDKKEIAIVLDTIAAMGSHVVIKMTFVPAAKEAGRWNLASAKVRTGSEEAKEMPIPGEHDAKSASFGKNDSFGTLVGKEKLTLPIGTVEAKHFHKEGTPAVDVWMNDTILPVGMVKFEGGGGHVELVATGKNGSTKF